MSSHGGTSRSASPARSIDYDIDLDEEFPPLQQPRPNMAVPNAGQHLPPMVGIQHLHIDDHPMENAIQPNVPEDVRAAEVANQAHVEVPERAANAGDAADAGAVAGVAANQAAENRRRRQQRAGRQWAARQRKQRNLVDLLYNMANPYRGGGKPKKKKDDPAPT